MTVINESLLRDVLTLIGKMNDQYEKSGLAIVSVLEETNARLDRIEALLPAPRQGPLTKDEGERLFDRMEALTAGDYTKIKTQADECIEAALEASEDVER